MIFRLFSLLVLVLVLAGCASGPRFAEDDAAALRPWPRDIVTAKPFPIGKKLVWGGEIVRVENLADRSRLEVLAYPLDPNEKPMLDEPSQGRFLLEKPGYLEPADYPPRRLVTVVGVLKQRIEGKVGDAPYRYPVLEAEHIHLWPKRRPGLEWGGVHFGFGITISN